MNFSGRKLDTLHLGVKGNDRRAFTLIELLVVIGIIGVLIAILLPAVQMAREAARRMQCSNNLHQLAIATISYESTHRILPPAGMVDFSEEKFECQTGTMLSWITVLLPFMEQTPLFEQIDFNRSAIDQPTEVFATCPPSLRCASDQAIERYLVDPELTSNHRLAKGNYAVFVGPNHIDEHESYPGAFVGPGQKLIQISDGLSNTVIFSEVRTRAQEADQRGAWAVCWPGATLLSMDLHFYTDLKTGYRFNPALMTKGKGMTPNNQGPTFDPIYRCVDPDESQSLRMPCITYNSTPYATGNYLSAAPRSNHPGGVNASFGDGRVIFMINKIDEEVMAFLICSIDGISLDLSEVAK